MGFREGAFATVWEIKNQGDNFTKIRVSTSRKDKRTDEYVTDFSGFVSLIGDAHKNIGLIESALNGSDHCRIKFGACDVSNRYDKEAGREFTNFTLFAFEMADGVTSSGDDKQAPAKTAPKAQKKAKPVPQLEDDSDSDGEGDDELPF